VVSNPSTALLLSAARLFACIICGLLFFSASHAQSSTTHIEGIVQDQTGAPVKGAEVTLRKESTVLAEATTDSGGRFQIETEAAREARLTVSAQGFTPLESRLSQSQTNWPEMKITLVPLPLSEQVTVTATRTETRLGDTAYSIATLSSTDLSTTAAATLDDTLRQVPGFSLFRRSGSRTANPTSQGVSLRGVGASGASRALVLADGIPLNDPFGGWVYWSRVPRTSVQSVEVLRGGASHLYGSAALGGVVHLLTREPQAPVFLLGARASPPKRFARTDTSSSSRAREAALIRRPTCAMQLLT
jgi:outer membrane receptor protein involved in Fe transport